jgi:phage virion morphogenesis protein
MAGASFSIDLSDITAMAAQFARAEAASVDLTPLMDDIGLALETTTDERFDAGRAPDGSAWAKGAKLTGKTLILDGFLKNSIGDSRIVTADSVTIGSPLEYARAHDQGYDEGNLPKRQFLGLGGDDEETIGELSADFLIQALAA